MTAIKMTKWGMSIKPDSICPFCNAHIENKVGDTLIEISNTPEECKQHIHPVEKLDYSGKSKDELIIKYVYCPYCQKTSYKVMDCERNVWINIYPKSKAKQFPNVPKDLYKDYSEACEILDLSPSASATLSRRCLQKMIRDRWNIELKNLINEINTIPATNISQIERDALHAVRQIGNIGAHPDKILEVEPEDAELTLRIIEIFLQKWYVDDPATQALLAVAIQSNQKKQNAKKSGQST